MRLAVVYARIETRQLLRFPAYWISTLGFSAIALLLFGRHLERGEPERFLAGFAATALLTVAFFQFGVGIAAGRATPWESYLRTLPVTPGERLAGRLLSALAFGVRKSVRNAPRVAADEAGRNPEVLRVHPVEELEVVA